MRARLRTLLRRVAEVGPYRLLIGLAVGLAVALAGLVVGQARPRSSPAPRAARTSADPRPAAAGAPASSHPVDLEGLRDLFRFSDGATPVEPRESEPLRGEEASAPAAAHAGPRLVGLVTRAGRLAAALAADGEVELALPGEKAAGVTVLEVGPEGALVRHPDGREELLALP
jgi:hypothetical protein